MPPATAAAPPAPTMPNATTSDQALKNIQDYSGSMVAPGAAMDQANAKFGVDAAQQQVQGLRGAINNTTSLLAGVMPSVMGRTSNSLVTAAQAGRIVQNESAPINDQLNKEQSDYAGANSDYQTALGKADNMANATLTGQQNQLSYLQNIYSDLQSKEQAAAQERAQQAALAEQQRQFDASMALSRQQLAASQAAASGLASRAASLLGGGGASVGGGGGGGAMAIPSFAKGTAPSAVVGQLFAGYKPGATPYYTENVVIPALEQLARMNHPNEPEDVIQAAARSLAYGYRKSTFGE